MHVLSVASFLVLSSVAGGQETCYDGGPIVGEGSCCQSEVCAIPCPEPTTPPPIGYGIAVISFAVVFCIIGFLTYFAVKGKAVNFFVAGRSLPLWVVVLTLASQSLDSNALLGNADLSYKFHFWDGVVLPIGLGLSLIINGLFLAKKINEDLVFTLPDVFAKRYGALVEVLVSLITIASFLFLLAGNLVGMGDILGYLFQIKHQGAAVIWVAAFLVWAYTCMGGLFSVAYTDVAQASMGMTGLLITAFWLISNSDPNAPPPSVGFPGYIYPDNIGDGGVCDLYQGVPCSNNADACCYNEELALPADNGAYPIGDQRVFSDQMTNAYSLTPFPNAIFWNWCTIFILAFGNLSALDFQARCMASKTPKTAAWGCLIAGCLTFLIGVPYAYLGSITRVHYGPDSTHAVFSANTCSKILGLPTCAEWIPDQDGFLKLLTHETPKVLGGWALVGIVAASMSTADGAILAMGTVFSSNIMRNIAFVSDENLLRAARGCTVPFTVLAALIATFNQEKTGYLLIVAFDIVFASTVVPLFGCFYSKNPRPTAALFAVLSGMITRIVLEFVLPKDQTLILPFPGNEFLKYGDMASSKAPVFVDAQPEDVWDAQEEQCNADRYRDFTGVDSMSAFFVSLLVYLSFAFIERKGLFKFTRLNSHRLMQPYTKTATPSSRFILGRKLGKALSKHLSGSDWAEAKEEKGDESKRTPVGVSEDSENRTA